MMIDPPPSEQDLRTRQVKIDDAAEELFFQLLPFVEQYVRRAPDGGRVIGGYARLDGTPREMMLVVQATVLVGGFTFDWRDRSSSCYIELEKRL